MSSDAQTATSLIGRTIGGRFTIKATIGSGGMGHVYRATQSPLNREVAIKVLRVDLAHQEGVSERFEREALAASRIQHPNAITIFEFGKDGEILFLAMEFLAGETLRQRLRRDPPLEVDEALDMFEAMAGALGAAHKVGVVHRDLKPDNIFLAKFDSVGVVVKVLDFGLAKLLDTAAQQKDQLTAPNLRLGTPRFMAPEQALGIQPIDSRCDVYALGLLLFEMLAQRAPFVGDDGMEVLAQRLRREAPRLSVIAAKKNFSGEMDDLLASLLKRDREHRPQDANIVLSRLREIRKNNQVFRTEESANDTLISAPSESVSARNSLSRSGNNIPHSVSPAPSGRLRSAGESGQHRAPVSRPDPMVRLDQDDFPEKPTVVVDPGMIEGPTVQPGMLSGPVSAAPRISSPAIKPVSLPPEGHGPMYVSGSYRPVSNPSVGSSRPNVPAISGSYEKRRGTTVLVVLVIVIAVLAPIIALLFRYTSLGSSQERSGLGPKAVPPNVISTQPPQNAPASGESPATKPAEVKAASDPTVVAANPDKNTKKVVGKKKGGTTSAKPKPGAKNPF